MDSDKARDFITETRTNRRLPTRKTQTLKKSEAWSSVTSETDKQ
jgi:hypothetical protein